MGLDWSLWSYYTNITIKRASSYIYNIIYYSGNDIVLASFYIPNKDHQIFAKYQLSKNSPLHIKINDFAIIEVESTDNITWIGQLKNSYDTLIDA